MQLTEHRGGTADLSSSYAKSSKMGKRADGIKKIRHRLGITQAESALKIFSTTATVSNWENKRTLPSQVINQTWGMIDLLIWAFIILPILVCTQVMWTRINALDWKSDKAYKTDELHMQPRRISGDQIRRLRAHLGLSQAALAKQCGVTTAAVSNWETNRAIPSQVCVHAYLPSLIIFTLRPSQHHAVGVDILRS